MTSRFCVTIQRKGLFNLVEGELRSLAPELEEFHMDEFERGKAFFRLPRSSLCDLRQLKSAERVLLSVWRGDVPQADALQGTHPVDWFLSAVSAVEWAQVFLEWSEALGLKGQTEPSTFKVECRRSGKCWHPHTSESIAGMVGQTLLSLVPSLRVDCSDPDLQVDVFLSDKTADVCVPLLRQQIQQGYICTTGLHPSVAFAMASASANAWKEVRQSADEKDRGETENEEEGHVGRSDHVEPGPQTEGSCETPGNTSSNRRRGSGCLGVWMDPMCGRGVVLTEAISLLGRSGGSLFLGGDTDPLQLQGALENLRALQRRKGARGRGACPSVCEVVLWDVRRLPLRPGVVDASACDMPFGVQHGSEEGNKVLYPLASAELKRVMADRGVVVLLTGVKSSRWISLGDCGEVVGEEREGVTVSPFVSLCKPTVVRLGFKASGRLHVFGRGVGGGAAGESKKEDGRGIASGGAGVSEGNLDSARLQRGEERSVSGSMNLDVVREEQGNSAGNEREATDTHGEGDEKTGADTSACSKDIKQKTKSDGVPLPSGAAPGGLLGLSWSVQWALSRPPMVLHLPLRLLEASGFG
uniref:THUMP domain-containing protein n=1 Tax=Chromera velia CCMP2878 TaxID=1169474 RepID=A0A0G4G6Z9_9ALVE|eukprot:Cvel_20566.t1-p1 / transcript=Cvel_20566.t1 / gene=Cvel_20566 / organism=Chromera_velia_CCMP2878 / gene_product=THUMP domain-containing protein 3, putative / transcript_product=THUMP domain-containing protein 3, putative / location=Cvel_scaffold1857:21743-23491(-) / protein_length=583 / sequence_SO=supercontig / SO=protein_coding / is_pseudo=false